MTITQAQAETNEALLGQGLMQHLKAYIQTFVSEQASLQDVDIEGLAAKITQIMDVVDGDPDSKGYQAFQGLLSDVSLLKTDNTSNKSRLTAVESALTTLDAAWQAEIARVESESKGRDTALGLRVDGVEGAIAQYAAARLEKDTEHDGKIATLEAFKLNVSTLLQQEIDRALAKEAALQASITANTGEIDAIKGREATYAKRTDVDSGFAVFANAMVTEAWAGRTIPEGLPVLSSVE